MMFIVGIFLISSAQSGTDGQVIPKKKPFREFAKVSEWTERMYNVEYNFEITTMGMNRHYLKGYDFPKGFEAFVHGFYEFTYHKQRFWPVDKHWETHAKGHGNYHGSLIHDGIKEEKTRIKCHHHIFVKDPAYKKRDGYNQTSAYCDCLFENGITKCDLEKEHAAAQKTNEILLSFNSPLKFKSNGKYTIQKRNTDWYVFVYAWVKRESIPFFAEDPVRQPLILTMVEIFKRLLREGGEGACSKIILQIPVLPKQCTPITVMLKVHQESNPEAQPYDESAGESDTDFVCRQAIDLVHGKKVKTGRPW